LSGSFKKMAVVAFDTLEMVKELKAAGFSEDQAEAVTRVVRRSRDIDMSHLATKADLAETRAELKAAIAETKAEIIKWMFGTIGFQTLIIIGAVIALARLTAA
jgi:hypothetical protein